MARARLLKPSFFKNARLARLGDRHKVVFQGLWTLADREGRLLDQPDHIRAEIYPYDVFDIEPFLTDLAREGFIVRYAFEPTRTENDVLFDPEAGRAIAVVKFLRHQNPHHREAPSKIPKPPQIHDIRPELGQPRARPRLAQGKPSTSRAVYGTGTGVRRR